MAVWVGASMPPGLDLYRPIPQGGWRKTAKKRMVAKLHQLNRGTQRDACRALR